MPWRSKRPKPSSHRHIVTLSCGPGTALCPAATRIAARHAGQNGTSFSSSGRANWFRDPPASSVAGSAAASPAMLSSATSL